MSAAQNDNKLIVRFLQTIAAEKAVSKHTLAAYQNDLFGVAAGLAHLPSDTGAGGLQTAPAICAGRRRHGVRTIRRLSLAPFYELDGY